MIYPLFGYTCVHKIINFKLLSLLGLPAFAYQFPDAACAISDSSQHHALLLSTLALAVT